MSSNKAEMIYALAGTIIGSMGEELLEVILKNDTGSPEFGIAGEVIGSVVGFLVSKSETRKELMNALRVFNKFVFKAINKEELESEIDEEIIGEFSEKFNGLDSDKKKRIMNAFKFAYPHEYATIFE